MSTEYSQQRKWIRFAVILLTTLAFICIAHTSSYAANTSAPSAKGQVNAKKGVYLMSKASSSSKKVVKVKNNAKITIIKEVYLKENKNSKKYVWYYVKAGKRKGYLPASKVDNVKYSSVKGITTSDLNWRVGPNTKMERKGTFKEKAILAVVLKANVKGSSTIWYKIKKGKKYYYVCGDWVKLGAADIAETIVTPTNDLKPNNPDAIPDATPTFKLKNLTCPETVLEKMPFVLKGTIESSQTITSAKFGILNSSGKWVIAEEVTVNSKEFKIATVDKNIKFGTLKPGKYTYMGVLKVYGKDYIQVSKTFTVKKSTAPQKLTGVAQQLGWPWGTDKSVYGSKPTEAYAAALDQVYPDHASWKKGPDTGASCDVFVGTIVRYSGVDPDFPRSLGKQRTYMENHPEKWVAVPYTYKEEELQSGDIIVYTPTSGGSHILMYLNIDGKGYCAEASYPRALYGFINTYTSKIFKSSDKKKMQVFRANM